MKKNEEKMSSFSLFYIYDKEIELSQNETHCQVNRESFIPSLSSNQRTSGAKLVTELSGNTSAQSFPHSFLHRIIVKI